MYRHNENDECIIFYFLVFITCVSPICQYFEMILSVYYDVASTLKWYLLVWTYYDFAIWTHIVFIKSYVFHMYVYLYMYYT